MVPPLKAFPTWGAQPGWLFLFRVVSRGLGRIEVTPQQWHGQVHEDEIADTAQNFRHDAGVLQLPQLPWPRGMGRKVYRGDHKKERDYPLVNVYIAIENQHF